MGVSSLVGFWASRSPGNRTTRPTARAPPCGYRPSRPSTMAPTDYGRLPGDVAHEKLCALQNALLNLDLYGIIDPLELKRLVVARQRHDVSARMSPDELRRVTMALWNLGQYIGVLVTAGGATTGAEPAIDGAAAGTSETGAD
ncbi:hypothetical protein MTO96_036188 [Rhipicephalus appendiculatus]